MKKVPLSPHTIQIQLYGNWQQKSTIISTATQILLFLLLICPFQKGRMRNIQSLRRCPRRYFALHPYVITFFKLTFIEISSFSLFDHSIPKGNQAFRDDITQAGNRIQTNACNFVDTHYDILYNYYQKGG